MSDETPAPQVPKPTLASFVSKDDPWAEKVISFIRAAGNEFNMTMLTLMLMGTSCWMWLHGSTLPPELIAADSLVTGFWFKNFRENRPTNGETKP